MLQTRTNQVNRLRERGLITSQPDVLVTEFTGSEEITTLQNAKACRDGDRVEILDSHIDDLFVLMFDSDLEHVTVLTLQQEEEGTLIDEERDPNQNEALSPREMPDSLP